MPPITSPKGVGGTACNLWWKQGELSCGSWDRRCLTEDELGEGGGKVNAVILLVNDNGVETSFFHSLKKPNSTWFVHLIAYYKSCKTISSCFLPQFGAKCSHLVCLSRSSPLNLVRPSSYSLIRFILQLPTSCDASLPSSCFIFPKLSLLLSSK